MSSLASGVRHCSGSRSMRSPMPLCRAAARTPLQLSGAVAPPGSLEGQPLHLLLVEPAPDPGTAVLLLRCMVARDQPGPIGILPFVDLDLHALPSVDDRRASGHHRVDLGQLRRRTVAGLLILGPPHLFAELRHDEPPCQLAKVDGERLPRAPRYRDLRATLGKRPRRGLPVVNTHRSAPPRFGDAQFAAHAVAAVGQPSLDRSGRAAMAGGYLGDAHSVQIERPQRPIAPAQAPPPRRRSRPPPTGAGVHPPLPCGPVRLHLTGRRSYAKGSPACERTNWGILDQPDRRNRPCPD